jgi:DNA-directed RNA polymerase specialized sigma24 family protein
MATIKPATDLLTLLRQSHARIYRIALALCGNRQSAEAVVERVLRSSGNISRRWETDEDAQRWFMHYTVLLCRRTNNERKNAGSEVIRRAGSDGEKPGSSAYLRTGVGGNEALLNLVTDPDSVSILHAIQQLPTQQREAFLLHHGEEMDLRQMATAMDCSSAAAANHLVAAVKALKESHLVGIGEFTARLPAMLRQLVPPANELDGYLKNLIAVQRRRMWIWQVVTWFLRILLLALLAWLIWWIHRRVEIV